MAELGDPNFDLWRPLKLNQNRFFVCVREIDGILMVRLCWFRPLFNRSDFRIIEDVVQKLEAEIPKNDMTVGYIDGLIYNTRLHFTH